MNEKDILFPTSDKAQLSPLSGFSVVIPVYGKSLFYEFTSTKSQTNYFYDRNPNAGDRRHCFPV
jgi:hypothetical protein